MAWIKDLDDVSSAVMCMDTLAMDSMDMRRDSLPNVEAPPAFTAPQLKERSNTDSRAGERMQDDIQVVTGAQEFDSSEAKHLGYDDGEGLMTDPGTPDTPQEEFPQDVDELDETNDMNLDDTENDVEEGKGSDDEALDSDPGTPQEEFAQDVDELDETNDMNLDETENDVEEEKGFDDEALDSDPGTPQEETPDVANEVDETIDMNVDGTENDLEVLGDGVKNLDNEKFMAPFPVARVKRIIKLDKDVRFVTSDAVALIAQTTALFVQSLSSASFKVMLQTKRRTIRGPDVVLAAESTL